MQIANRPLLLPHENKYISSISLKTWAQKVRGQGVKAGRLWFLHSLYMRPWNSIRAFLCTNTLHIFIPNIWCNHCGSVRKTTLILGRYKRRIYEAAAALNNWDFIQSDFIYKFPFIHSVSVYDGGPKLCRHKYMDKIEKINAAQTSSRGCSWQLMTHLNVKNLQKIISQSTTLEDFLNNPPP